MISVRSSGSTWAVLVSQRSQQGSGSAVTALAGEWKTREPDVEEERVRKRKRRVSMAMLGSCCMVMSSMVVAAPW